MPAETTVAVCAVLLGGVLERFPRLRMCFAHGCGMFPYTLGRIEHGFNVRPDLVQTDTTTNPRHHLGRIWSDSLVHDPAALQLLVSVMGAVRVCANVPR